RLTQMLSEFAYWYGRTWLNACRGSRSHQFLPGEAQVQQNDKLATEVSLARSSSQLRQVPSNRDRSRVFWDQYRNWEAGSPAWLSRQSERRVIITSQY